MLNGLFFDPIVRTYAQYAPMRPRSIQLVALDHMSISIGLRGNEAFYTERAYLFQGDLMPNVLYSIPWDGPNAQFSPDNPVPPYEFGQVIMTAGVATTLNVTIVGDGRILVKAPS
jgi:hypothetical protein